MPFRFGDDEVLGLLREEIMGLEKNFGGSRISVCAADGDLRLRAAPAAGGFSQVSGRFTFNEEVFCLVPAQSSLRNNVTP